MTAPPSGEPGVNGGGDGGEAGSTGSSSAADTWRGPLADLRVLDCSTVIAGPGCAKYLADFGADVIKIERPPTGDSTRTMGLIDPTDGVSLAWKLWNRGKRVIALDLRSDHGREALLRLVETANVLVENLRPGKMAQLGLGPDVLLARNPRLVITSITGFGQDGPYANRPGFATIAEAMGGWAALNGMPDGPPLLPPIALTDELTGLTAAFGTMVALHSGVGQVVDANLLDSLLQVMGAIIPAYFRTGFLQQRMGSSLPNSVPRGAWPTADGKWIALSASSDSVAARLMKLIGFGDDERLRTVDGRAAHRDLIDDALARFIGSLPAQEVLRRFEAADAAAGLVMDFAELSQDPHVIERQTFVDVDGIRMQNVVARLSGTPGRIRWPGRPYGADNESVLAEVDLGPTGEPLAPR